jgi:hypothetical protein
MISIATAPRELLFRICQRAFDLTSQNGEFRHNCVNQLSSPVTWYYCVNFAIYATRATDTVSSHSIFFSVGQYSAVATQCS